MSNTILKILSFLATVITIITQYACNQQIKHFTKQNKDYKWPSLYEILQHQYYLIPILLISRYFFLNIFQKLIFNIYKNKSKCKFTDEEITIKSKSNSENLFKLIFYVQCQYSCFKQALNVDQNDKQLFGIGSQTNFCKGQPFNLNAELQRKEISYAYALFLSQTLSSTIDLFINIKSTFWEYQCHHTLTICLVMISQMTNFIQVGSIVIQSQQYSDIIFSGARTFIDVQTPICIIFWLILQFAWPYTRIYNISLILINCYKTIFSNDDSLQNNNILPNNVNVIYGMLCLLFILLIMHFHWMYLLYVKTQNDYQRRNERLWGIKRKQRQRYMQKD